MNKDEPKGTELLPMEVVEQMARYMAVSQMFGFKTPEQAISLMLVAQAEGRHPASVAMDYDVIQGRPALKASCQVARFQQAGGKIEWHSLDDTIAEATFSHPSGGSIKIKWDMQTAARAGLSGRENWKKYPRAMLRSRCCTEGIRTVYPAVLSGMYTTDEVRDFSESDPVFMGSAEVVEQQPPVQNSEAPTKPTPKESDTVKTNGRIFSDDEFAKYRDGYRKIIESGKKTPAQLISMLETSYSLTLEQRAEIAGMSKVSGYSGAQESDPKDLDDEFYQDDRK